MKLLINRPAPMSRISESAISETTSRLRTRLPPTPPVDPLPPSLSDSFGSDFEDCNAGAIPKINPVTSDTASGFGIQQIAKFEQLRVKVSDTGFGWLLVTAGYKEWLTERSSIFDRPHNADGTKCIQAIGILYDLAFES